MGIPQNREKIVREVVIPEVITIQELANRMTERAVDVIKYLMKEGAMHQINDVVDADTAELIVQEFGHTPKRVSEVGRGDRLHRREGRRGRARAARARRDHHGSRRPRQDVASRRHPPDQRGVGRGRRHHAAHRRLSGHDARGREDHLHRHAGPRGLHGHARARRQGDRHRRARGGGRRRRHAADGRGHQPRQGGRRADHRRHQQDRQAAGRSRTGCAPSCCSTRSWSRACRAIRWRCRCRR